MTPEEVFAEKLQIESEMPFDKRLEVKTPYQQLRKIAVKRGDFPAVSFQITSDPNGKHSTLWWSELLAKTTQTANLLHSLGIRSNDTVAFMLPTMNETVSVLIGAMTAGTVNPINPLLEPEQISSILNETQAKVLITLKSFPKTDLSQKAAHALANAPSVKHLIEIDLLQHLSGLKKAIVPFLRPKTIPTPNIKRHDFAEAIARQPANKLVFAENDKDRTCALFHTGGTTGMPKVAQHRYSGVLYNGWVNSEHLLEANDVVLCPLPLFHVMAAYPILMGCLFSGSHLVMVTPAGYRGEGVVKNFWKLIEAWRVSIIVMVPTAAAALLEYPIGDANLSSMRVALSGSSPMPPQLFNRFQDEVGVKIIEGYGMTEATCLVSSNHLEADRKIGSVGIPVPYTKIGIFNCDENGTIESECANNEVGEICISNPGISSKTYTEDLKNNGLYADKNGESYLRSGDLGYLDEDGYLWITGRKKDLIIRSGHNLDPLLIEDALMSHPEIAFVGAIGQPDRYAGETPAVYVETTGGSKLTADEVLVYASEKISERAAVPKYVELVVELPKTAIGKVFKPDLRKMAITRVFDEALSGAGLSERVQTVAEVKGRGLVAIISTSDKSASTTHLQEALGEFTTPWATKHNNL
ncbi:MAG: acyl-CoA synthetase [Pseudomonadota bacterium]